jgi:hypothetical protein
MVVLNPEAVLINSAAVAGVSLVTVGEETTQCVEEYEDRGPWAVFGDSVQRRVRVMIRQTLEGGGGAGDSSAWAVPAAVGAMVAVVVRWSDGGGRGAREMGSGESLTLAQCVMLSVSYSADERGGVVRTMTLAGLSTPGKGDSSPVMA